MLVYTVGDPQTSWTFKALGQFINTGVPVVHRAGTLLIRRLPRQQPRQSSAVPGSPGACSWQRYHHRDCSSLSAASRAQTSSSQHVYHHRTNGQATAGQPRTYTHHARQVCVHTTCPFVYVFACLCVCMFVTLVRHQVTLLDSSPCPPTQRGRFEGRNALALQVMTKLAWLTEMKHI